MSIFLRRPALTSEMQEVSEMIEEAANPPRAFLGHYYAAIGERTNEGMCYRPISSAFSTPEGVMAWMVAEGKAREVYVVLMASQSFQVTEHVVRKVISYITPSGE